MNGIFESLLGVPEKDTTGNQAPENEDPSRGERKNSSEDAAFGAPLVAGGVQNAAHKDDRSENDCSQCVLKTDKKGAETVDSD